MSDMLSKVEAMLDDCLTTVRIQYTGRPRLVDVDVDVDIYVYERRRVASLPVSSVLQN